jgi:hypothetical protein
MGRIKRYLLIAGVALTLLVFWPWIESPFAFVHWKDRIRTSIPVALVLGFPCEETLQNGAIFRDVGPDCYRYDAPREFRGIWLYEFEGSFFLENATFIPSERPAFSDTAWLEFGPDVVEPPTDSDYSEEKSCYPISAYAITFVGRRNRYGSGHLGLWPESVRVDKMLSVHRLPAPSCEAYRIN